MCSGDAPDRQVVPQEIRRLHLEPGERLIVRVSDTWTTSQQHAYHERLASHFPANDVLVLVGEEILVDHPGEPPC